MLQSAIAVASRGSNRLDIFVVGTNGNLYYKALNGITWLPSQTGYDNLGGPCASAPAVVSRGPNMLDIFVVGTNGTLWHTAWNGTTWEDGYDELGGQIMIPHLKPPPPPG